LIETAITAREWQINYMTAHSSVPSVSLPVLCLFILIVYSYLWVIFICQYVMLATNTNDSITTLNRILQYVLENWNQQKSCTVLSHSTHFLLLLHFRRWT